MYMCIEIKLKLLRLRYNKNTIGSINQKQINWKQLYFKKELFFEGKKYKLKQNLNCLPSNICATRLIKHKTMIVRCI
jgi:hypothetical protein